MKPGDYVLFRSFGSYPEHGFRIGRLITRGSTHIPHSTRGDHDADTHLYVHELHQNLYWTSFVDHCDGTYSLRGSQIIPAPDHLIVEALALSLQGEVYNISVAIGVKLIQDYCKAKGIPCK